jgi:ribosomal protein S18 acetylase RimI-like enzyme
MEIEGFDPREVMGLVRMWRDSFEFGVGITDPHPIEEQVAFLLERLAPANTMRVAKSDGHIVGFSATTPESVGALYVRVDRIGQGIGSELLRLAKADSCGSLWLYTFARNARARRFYERHGFVAVAHGFEPEWQLEDVRYEWSRSRTPP